MDRYTDINIKEAYDIENPRDTIKQKLRQYYDGRIVRKDLTKAIREGANVPVYVLEYLLGQYCNSDDQEIIDDAVRIHRRLLPRPDPHCTHQRQNVGRAVFVEQAEPDQRDRPVRFRFAGDARRPCGRRPGQAGTDVPPFHPAPRRL